MGRRKSGKGKHRNGRAKGSVVHTNSAPTMQGIQETAKWTLIDIVPIV
jgi:hypothetical protein